MQHLPKKRKKIIISFEILNELENNKQVINTNQY